MTSGDQARVAQSREGTENLGVEVWKRPNLMCEIAELGTKGKAYLRDDTLRTITLFTQGLAK